MTINSNFQWCNTIFFNLKKGVDYSLCVQRKGNQRVEDGEKNEGAWKAWMTCWESEKQKFEFIKLLLKENENNCNYFQVRKWVNSWKNWLKCSLVTASPKSYSKCAAAAAVKLLQSWPTLRPHRRQATRLPRPWDSPGKSTGVGCHFLLHRYSNTNNSNPPPS